MEEIGVYGQQQVPGYNDRPLGRYGKEVPAYLDEQYIGKRQVKKEDGTVITFDGSNASEMVGYYMPTNVQPRNTFSDRSYCSPVGEQEINAYAEKGFKLTQTTGW
ncbi:MAG: hypothetical protein ACLUE2_07960 [Bacteroides cellulosilyticus]